MYSKADLSEPFAKFFNHTWGYPKEHFDKLNIWDTIKFADQVYAEVFEGVINPLDHFTQNQWDYINRLITSWTEQ